MNKHHYKVIFDRDLQPTVAVSELAKSRSKSSRIVCTGDVVVFSDKVVRHFTDTLNTNLPGLVNMADKGIHLSREYLDNSIKAMEKQGTKVALSNGLVAGTIKLGFEANDYLSGNKELTKANVLNSTKEVGYSTGLGLATSGMPLAPTVGLSVAGDWVKEGRYDVIKTSGSTILSSGIESKFGYYSAYPVVKEVITNSFENYYEGMKENNYEKK